MYFGYTNFPSIACIYSIDDHVRAPVPTDEVEEQEKELLQAVRERKVTPFVEKMDIFVVVACLPFLQCMVEFLQFCSFSRHKIYLRVCSRPLQQEFGATEEERRESEAFCTRSTLRRYLRARKYNMKQAVEGLADSLRWRHKYKPHMIK